MRMQQEGFKSDKKQNFPKADNYLDNLDQKGFSSITFSTLFFFCTELFILAFIHLCNKH